MDFDEAEFAGYVSIKELVPAQTRYSILNTHDKANRAVIRGDAVWDELRQRWNYKHHNGTSIFSEKDALPVVRTAFGYVLIDGHHDVMSSIHLDADMIPIKIIKNLSHLSEDEFWQEAEEKGWSYLFSVRGEKMPPPKFFSNLIDDPNRYFAAITARKFTTDSDGSYTSKGAEYPLWVKVDKDIPFIEFKIANALYENGFVYSPDHMGNPPAESVAERARQLLIDADIEGLKVVPYRLHHEKFRMHDDYVKIKVPGPDIELKSRDDDYVKGVKQDLLSYVNRIESHKTLDGKIDFTHGFWFFKHKRAQTREARYEDAKKRLLGMRA